MCEHFERMRPHTVHFTSLSNTHTSAQKLWFSILCLDFGLMANTRTRTRTYTALIGTSGCWSMSQQKINNVNRALPRCQWFLEISPRNHSAFNWKCSSARHTHTHARVLSHDHAPAIDLFSTTTKIFDRLYSVSFSFIFQMWCEKCRGRECARWIAAAIGLHAMAICGCRSSMEKHSTFIGGTISRLSRCIDSDFAT